MQVAIRADASRRIGSGHVMRCLTLAHALHACGASVRFVCRDLPGHLNEHVVGEGFPIHRLTPSEAPRSWEADAAETSAALAGQVDWLILDHYELDARWERALRPLARRIMVIDDLADRPHDCDLLLDQNFTSGAPEERYRDRVPAGCRVLAGPRYALLRDEFRRRRLAPRSFGKPPLRLLVAFGGGDPTGETAKVLEALQRLVPSPTLVDVVLGPQHTDSEVSQLAAEMPSVQLHPQTDQMASLMEKADFAIGAGGTTHYERCMMGLPSVIVTIAANQEPATGALAEAGAVLHLGRAGEVTPDDYMLAMALMSRTPSLRTAMARAAQSLVDGRGVDRVTAELLYAGLSLRPADASDAERLLAWRNHEANRRWSFDSSPIPREDHLRWFDRAIADPARILLVGEHDGEGVGVLRYDLAGEVATVSVYLAPEHHGRGIGGPLLRAGSAWLRTHSPAIRRIDAEILEVNAASRKAFEQAGYHRHHSIYHYEMEPRP